MQHNTGYVITPKNSSIVSHVTGIEQKIVDANIGWVALYEEYTIPRWSLVPSSVARAHPEFEPIETRLDDTPVSGRDLEEIEQEKQDLQRAYNRRMRELNAEYDRRSRELSEPSA